MAEYAIIVPLHLLHLRKQLVELTAEAQLTPLAQELFVTLYARGVTTLNFKAGYMHAVLFQRADQQSLANRVGPIYDPSFHP